jgi:uncharacterized protein (TIGR00255 family)
MIQSMTGFGSAEKNGCRVEIRSLNHRFLDIYIKAPAFFNQFEISFRNALKGRFSRGKFDVNFLISENVNKYLDINTDFVEKIYAAIKRLQEDLSIPGRLDINAIANFREMFIETSQKYDIDTINSVFQQALESLYKMRIKEGEALAAGLHPMIDFLNFMNEKIKNLSTKVLSNAKEKLNDRLKVLLEGNDIDSNRLLQEAAVMAAKLDVTEEIVRIESHLRQFRAILTDGDIIGRKLDFILQELNREVNTISSKSADYSIASLTIEMKTELEKIKEQVQNIQ